MNLVDAVVTKVISEPYLLFNKYWVDVEYNCYDRYLKQILCVQLKKLLKQLKLGIHFKFKEK